ncbi:unnamed protein product [Phaedon cochleariae]|uniref:Eukaryotic translation initiation factor 4E binding protein n=1 Tax=Phaedon cochleariae TaxID=80249 RepID=A0A9N9SBF0_PHACE|nr:unnamed protein product [Phaedon cochleariae]
MIHGVIVMSASPMARQVAESKAIPIKRVLINDPSELPSHYCSTPGGTLFSTTPGGTKIVYEKSFLMNLRNSPISKTPPTFEIPENLMPGSSPKAHGISQKTNKLSTPKKNQHQNVQEDQFQIEL